MPPKKIYVINNLGERELLSEHKIIASARRSGADLKLARSIAEEIRKKVKDNTRTYEIYGWIKKILIANNPKSGMKYSLKEAIRKLGPTGYWFEKYVSKIFSVYDYKVKINQIIQGKCTDFEIDVLLLSEKYKELIFGECKYHNQVGTRVNISVILENYASFLDLKNGKLANDFLDKGYVSKRLIITNTKFTSKAIDYANCYGVSLLGWKHPKDKGLEYYIEGNGYYPITILPSVDDLALTELYNRDILFAKELLDPNIQKNLIKKPLNNVNLKKIIREAEILFGE